MANEIIALERVGGKQSYGFLFVIPTVDLITIGDTGEHPVYSPTSGIPEYALAVITTAEKAAHDIGTDAGEAAMHEVNVTIDYDDADNPVAAGDTIEWVGIHKAGSASDADAIVLGFIDKTGSTLITNGSTVTVTINATEGFFKIGRAGGS